MHKESKKQSLLDSFFCSPKNIITAANKKINEIKSNLEKNNEKKQNLCDIYQIENSRGSSPIPSNEPDDYQILLFNENIKNNLEKKINDRSIHEDNSIHGEKKIEKDENNESDNNFFLEIQTPKPLLSQDENKNSNLKRPECKELNLEERNDLHFQLEILEHRIQFGKDPSHMHPAMSIDVLAKEGLKNIKPRELTRKKYYKQVDYVQYLPEFWDSRPWDDEYVKMTYIQSEKLRQDIIEMPLAKSKNSEYVEDFSSETSESNSSSDSYGSSSDDESKKKSSLQDESNKANENTQKLIKRVRFGMRTRRDSENETVSQILRLPSLLFDTDDDELLTDLEDF